MKKLIVFDLDGTLAPSKSSLDGEMSSLLHDLIGIVRVAVISGGACNSLIHRFSPSFRTTKGWQAYPFSQPVEHNSSNSRGSGRDSMQKISPLKKKKKSSTL